MSHIFHQKAKYYVAYWRANSGHLLRKQLEQLNKVI